jgi:drug/metabolite transporter superfamily protein YnfA
MNKTFRLGVGVVLVLFGGLFTLQGLNVVKGSAMTGSTFWAVAGPIIALVGVALVVASLRGGRRRTG